MDDLFNAGQKEAVAYFKANVDEWIKDPLYRYKYVIIHDSHLAGLFDTFDAALAEAVPKYPQNDFIIQQVIGANDMVNILYPAII